MRRARYRVSRVRHARRGSSRATPPTVSDVRLGKDASAAFLKRADLRRYRVLHFATHAVVDEQSLARTALAPWLRAKANLISSVPAISPRCNSRPTSSCSRRVATAGAEYWWAAKASKV